MLQCDMQGEEILIATQNARSLGQGFFGRRKRKEIQHLFKHTTPKTDILLLQETKLPEDASLKQARFIEFKGGTSFWNEASFSAQTGKYTGGTGIVLSERLITAITHHGILFPGRAQFVVINLSPRHQLGVINVYGFSDTGPRAVLWNHLAQASLPEAEWVWQATLTISRASKTNKEALTRPAWAIANWKRGTNSWCDLE